MGYLDYAGLQYLWGKLKEKFAPKSHSHDDRYYTEAEMDGKLNSKVNNNEAGADSLLSKLTTSWTATPTDNTYFIRQDTGGGNSFGRVKFSTLWTYIKSKADGVYQPKGSYAASSHTHDDRYYTESEMNTKLSAKAENIVLASDTNLDNVTTPGFYSCGGGNSISNKPTGTDAIGLIVTHNASGDYYTQILTTSSNANTYRRTCLNGTWSGWTQDKYTDTNTWRGIQNNLTSDSTSDSLSAAQGKALKGLIDGKAPNGHTHSFASITDKPSTYTPSAHNQSWSTITDKPALMESGDYSAETIEALLKRVQGLSPRMGSCCFAKDTHVANTWWNFIYTPHRTGSGGDNPEYGTLLLFPMVGAGSSYIVRAGKDGVVKEIRKIYTSGDKPTKGDVGLGNVDNTADANKSVKYATSAGSASTATKATTAGTADKANSVDWSKVQNKPSSYPPASHSHAYLPISGGTMSGALTFANNTWNPVGDDVQIGDHNTSGSFYVQGLNGPTNIKLKKKGDTSVGSGDSATITYDGGNLVIDKTIQANLSGNASTATKAVSADKATSAATADKAAKLTTARTVSGGTDITLSFNYDGSGNSNANIEFYNRNHTVQNTNNYPFHRFAKLDASKEAWSDKSMTFLINQDYSGGGYGICRLVYRSNADSSNASVAAEWLVRKGLSADSVQVAIKTDKTNGAYCDAFYKSGGTYNGCSIRALASGGRASQSRTWTLIGSMEASGTTTSDKKNSVECWKTIADAGTALHNQAYSSTASAVDSGYVNGAGTSNSCTGNAATATGVKDYGNTNKTIKIGYAGAGLTAENLNYVAGYTDNGTKIKDVSKDVLKSWIGLGNYLPLSGGTMSGQITKSTGGSWIGDRDRAAIKSSYAGDNAYGAVAGMATKNGYWTMGNLGGNESLIFNYSTDTNHNAGKNETSQVYLPAQAGTIITSATIGSQSVNYANSAGNATNATTATKLSSNAGSSVQPVYFSGGKPVAIGYTISSSVPANAKFTDTTYGVASSSSNGLMSSTDKTKLDDFSRVINFQKQIKLTTDWQDTGIAGNSLDTGTYVVQVSGFNSSYTQLYSEIYSGVMSWYSGTTNSGNSSEIFLHNAGLADNNNAIYLRTLRVAGSKTLKLQIACKVAATGTDTLTFKFRRLI